MLKGTRIRISVVLTVITGAVLGTVLGISAYSTVSQRVAEGRNWYMEKVESVASTAHVVSKLDIETLGFGESYPYVSVMMYKGNPVLKTSSEAAGDTMQAELFTLAKNRAAENETANWVEEAYPGQMYVAALNAGDFAGSAELVAEVQDVQRQWQVSLTRNSAAGIMEDVQTFVSGGPVAVAGSAVSYASSYDEDGLPVGEAETGIAVYMSPSIALASEWSSDFFDKAIFKLKTGDATWRATYFTIADAAGTGVYEIAVMEDLGFEYGAIARAVAFNSALLLVGLVLLFVVSWLIAGMVLKPAEENLRRQNEFVAAASHELRSPLAVIRSSLSAVDVAQTIEEAEKYRKNAEDEAARMGRLVDDLLVLAGGEGGGWKLTTAPVDLDTLLIEEAERFIPLARAHGLEVKMHLPEETLPTIKGDKMRLEQILSILLDNALEYAPEGTAIEVTAARGKRGKVCITVADHGVGISDEDKERVFGKFFRADESRGDKQHFGLGLSVAQQLAQMHGGKLCAADTEGGGASFVLELPVG